MLVMFDVVGAERVSFSCLSLAAGEYATRSQRLLTTDSVQVVVGNLETGEVYFNKTY